MGVKLGLSKDDSKGWISRNGSLALIVVFFIIFNRLKIRVVAAGCSDLNAVGIAVRVWKNVVIKAFCLVRALLNGYGQLVNSSLIHANRLDFG